MRAKELRTSKEKVLFSICMTLSIVCWLVVIITVVGVLYGLLIGFIVFVAHALWIAHIRGNGVKLSEQQLPDLYAKVVAAAQKFELEKVPDAYVVQAGGSLNAFATKLLGRKFIIIYSDLLEACTEDGKAVDMIIGHEMGHLALGHLKWLMFLAPARIIPWLGPAYSRACEYSCDLCGYEIAGNMKDAAQGLAILAAGGKTARQMDMNAFVNQSRELSGFWSSIYELNASHPYLPKRVAALLNWKTPNAVQVPRRHLLAYPLAPFFGFGGGGAAALPVIVIAIIGVMAAIAVPQFQKYRAMSEAVHQEAPMEEPNTPTSSQPPPDWGAFQEMDTLLLQGLVLAEKYAQDNGRWPCTIQEFGAVELEATAQLSGWRLEVDCSQNYLALFFDEGDQVNYRALMLDSGEFESGPIVQ